MKRSLVILMLFAVALMGVATLGVDEAGAAAGIAATGPASYSLPYLHTAAVNPIYCVISNLTNAGVTLGFQVTSTAAGQLSAAAADSLASVATASKTVNVTQTRMLSFEGQDIKMDGVKIADTASSTAVPTPGNSYGGIIIVTGASCIEAPMSCFQGTTTPKRNVVGYTCKDAGPNVLSY
ncbi:MAG: hypothetical protein HQL03_01925 [Nitrospirae bacterium]|nr:hypothetical protein [Nitrospirota bacterium]MBF0591302.1 hypothetical protein [Nitrospirota bacterium]